MANVFGVHPPSATGEIESISKLKPQQATSQASGINDTVEISVAGKLAAKIHDPSMVRMDLVQRVKDEIAAGVYETPERIEATVERLVEELFSDII